MGGGGGGERLDGWMNQFSDPHLGIDPSIDVLGVTVTLRCPWHGFVLK